MAPVKVVEQPPSPVGLIVRAALPAVPGVNMLPGVRRTATDLPDLELVRRAVPIDAGHVSSYASVCGFPAKDDLPLTYLHMLAFPLHLQVMTSPGFPVPAMGTVHLGNTITRHRRTTARDRYDVSVRASDLRGHAKGTAFDLLTQVRVDDEPIWEEVSTYLRRGRGLQHADSGTDIPPVDDGGVEWRLGGDLGRRYAAVSGDRNPIHLYRVTAKAFGFPRQIAHGMWSKARCVAAVENRLPDAVRVEAAFKTPVLLPGSVRFSTRRARDGTVAFGLVNARNGAPHLAGRAAPT